MPARFVFFLWVLGLLWGGPVFAAGELSLICSPSKTVACDRAWTFDDPVPASSCTNGNGYVDWQPFVTVTSGVCPKIITRTWTVSDYCGNTSTCSQVVTLLDTNPPAALCSGVNLVPNPSFEISYACPGFLSQVELASPWYPPSVATPDFFTACATSSLVHVPTNFAGNQAPLTGQAYLGAIVYRQTNFNDIDSYREYLQVPLIAPLVAGQTYLITFHVSLADHSPNAISTLGAHLSAGPVLLPFDDYVLPVTPQVVNPATNFLASTTAWMQVQGAYIAVGGEDHLTLGNFLSDLNTPNITNPGTNVYTYYYFDDISVTAVCDPSLTGKTVLCTSPWTFDAPLSVDPCAGTNVAVTVLATLTNNPCPLQLERRWKLTDPCGNTGMWSQVVNVQETEPPQVICPCIADSAVAQLNTNSCAGIVPDLSPATHCVEFACGAVTITQQPLVGTVLGPGIHTITTLVQSCSGSVSTCEVPFVVTAAAPVITTPSNLVVLTCSNSAPVSYLVTASGNAGPVVCTPPSGSVMTQGVTVVTCVATSACGGVATNTFTVTVKPPRARWFCGLVSVGIGVPHGPIGGATIAARTAVGGAGYPGIVVTGSPHEPTNNGVAFAFGPADAFRFSTRLDDQQPAGSTIAFSPPATAMDPEPSPLLRIVNLGTNGFGFRAGARTGAATSDIYRVFAVDTNGNLFNSFTMTAAEALTNDLLVVGLMYGSTAFHPTVEFDLRTGGTVIEFAGEIEPGTSARHKGWDGCIYGPDRPVKKPPKTARVIVLPPVISDPPPMEELQMRFQGMPEVAIEETALRKDKIKYSDGHVTLLKAFEDGAERGVDFNAVGPGGGVHVEWGYVASFGFNREGLHGGDVPLPFEEYRAIGWPPLTTTNRPPAPTNYLRLAGSIMGVGFDVSADFTEWGSELASVQLWHMGALVGEVPAHPALRDVPLVTLETMPSRIEAPGVGEWRLLEPGGISVMFGMDCGEGVPCIGDELRVIALPPPEAHPPLAFTGLDMMVAEDMDMRISGITAVPACTNQPLVVARAQGGVIVSWEGDGFSLQGAASIHGPWFDLGALSPVTLHEGDPLRVFRLLCE